MAMISRVPYSRMLKVGISESGTAGVISASALVFTESKKENNKQKEIYKCLIFFILNLEQRR